MHSIRFRALSIFPLALSLLLRTPSCAAEHWTEIRSLHYRVLTDNLPEDGRRFAAEFEQMRHVLEIRLSGGRIDANAPLTIFATSDPNTLRELDPVTFKSADSRVNGKFAEGRVRQFAIVRFGRNEAIAQSVVFFDLTQSALHANIRGVPHWLSIGLSEFYSYTRVQQDKILVGGPSIRIGILKTRPLVSISEMFTIKADSPYFKDPVALQIYYAEAWAMVHYMTFGEGMQNGEKFNAFLNLLRNRKSQQDAFHAVFGDPAAFEAGLTKYLTRLTFNASPMAPDKSIDPKTFQERKLTDAEIDYEIACLNLRMGNETNGRTLLEKSAALDPKLAGPHEELGYLHFDDGEESEAIDEWKKAQALDPATYRSLFALTMSSKPLAQQSILQLMATQTALRHVTELAPNFAPAYVQLALIEWRLNSFQQAYKDAHEAEKLDPARAGYLLLTGHILLNGNQAALAADYSRFVADHWYGIDHDEAVDLWNEVPAQSRGEGPPLSLDVPADSQMLRGKITDVACTVDQDKRTRIDFTFKPDQSSNEASSLHLTSATAFTNGFSDTLWWGGDHFNLCHHTIGHTALFAVKSLENSTGEFVAVEVREDLPKSASSETKSTTSSH